MVSELQVKDPMKLFYDNKVAINLFNNLVFYDHTKHVELDSRFIRKKIDFKEFILPYIRTQNQVADIGSPIVTLRGMYTSWTYLICMLNLKGSVDVYGSWVWVGSGSARPALGWMWVSYKLY